MTDQKQDLRHKKNGGRKAEAQLVRYKGEIITATEAAKRAGMKPRSFMAAHRKGRDWGN